MSSDVPRSIVVVVGPTGVGKTDVAFHLATQLGGEIVSADSRLVYRTMDIGTAKPDAAMRREVPHHMIDLVDPDRQYTSKDYERAARAAIEDILKRGKVPVVAGGTGLYVKALFHGIFDGPGANPELRRHLQDLGRREGGQSLWRRLSRVDPDKARVTDPRNLARVIRALEVFETTGEPMSVLERAATPFAVPFATIGLVRDRGDLYARIEQRVDCMIEAGLVDEVRGLVGRGYAESPVVKKTLGYGEILQYLRGDIPLTAATALIKKNTRHFAKRQLTWFRKDPATRWMDVTARSDYEAVAAEAGDLSG